MVICRAAVLLAGTIALLLPTPSEVHAATVSHATGAATLTNGSTLTITGEGTEADDLQVSSADGFTTLVVTGPTARAGAGCQQGSAEVRCPLAATLAPYLRNTTLDVDLGAGDDRLLVGPEYATRSFDSGIESKISGGDGADTVTAQGRISGGLGNDVLRINARSAADELDGGAGDDQLFAGGDPAVLIGGTGKDALHGGPSGDALIDLFDEGSRDTLHCGGGEDIAEGDRGDALRGCSVGSDDALATLKYHFSVYRGGLTHPDRLEWNTRSSLGYQSAILATCRGAACKRAHFDMLNFGHRVTFTLDRGGVRVPGTKRRAVLPGARIRVTWTAVIAGRFQFKKTLQFTTRARRLPVKRKLCSVLSLSGQEHRSTCA